MSASARCPIGVYAGNPNGNDATAEASFESNFNNFVLNMGGARPATMNAFTDFGQDPSLWAGNAEWTAWSWAKSPVVGTSITPVIGIPMSDNAHWAGNAAGWTNDDFFKGIVSGAYDADYKGVVDAWANHGFKTMELRLGYEMDGGFMPWFMGDDASTQSDWVKAFQHLSTLMRREATALGVTAKVVWNPADINWTNQSVQAAYPGDAYVDVIAADAYSPLYPKDLYDWAKDDGTVDASIQQWWANLANREHFWSHPNATQWGHNGTGNGFGLEDAIAMAKEHGKPLALSETGAGGNGTTTGPVDEADFPKWLAAELAGAQSQGVTIDHVNIWDAQLGDGNWDFSSPNAAKPLEAAAWAKYFGAIPGSGTATTGGAGVNTAVYAGPMSSYSITAGGGAIRVAEADIADTLRDIQRLSFSDGTFAAPGSSADPLVDYAYYYAHNPDVKAAGVDASAHYLAYGWKEGRNPSAWFDTTYYLAHNSDVKAAGIDPLLHFETYGWTEGRDPSLVFSGVKYFAANPDVKAAGVDPLQHYLSYGQSEGRTAFLPGSATAADPLVDATFYDRQLGATLIPAGISGQQQAAASYDATGWQKGLNPDAFFDTKYYLTHNPDVAAAHVNPLLHYEQYGWHEGRDPSAQFSANKYLATYSDVKAAALDPLLHYVQYGQAEGRTAFGV